ncbi:glycosyltransferase [Synechococcus sp. A10-1-5-1]|uniref:glycosyltransferase family 2 protein n=1 Tax=Synechococcus sp. A10-1-5-1 TaxID=2936507 RepID=UPI00200128D2|nr:glycosyltransferase family 2 protein [Synechococcus sp. A10-1-5-1]UPM49209.1 glycosyltransferase [Synechococcus sp. A10-1-5-1]
MNPLVSVITPYRNAKRFLSGFVDSLQCQTSEDWTCIMVDDGSSDGGPSFLAELVADDPRFQLISNTNLRQWPGPASARNCALAHVTTDYVAFCDVDDLWHPQKLERQLAFHCSNNLELTVSAYARFIDGQIDQPPQRVVCPPAQLVSRDLFGHNPIPMLTAILSADLARIGFSEVSHEDFLFWLDLFKARPSIRYGCLPEILAFYCIHPRSLSSQKAAMPFWAYRVFRNSDQSRCRSLFSLFFWVMDHILSRVLALRSSVGARLSIEELLGRPPLLLKRVEWF